MNRLGYLLIFFLWTGCGSKPVGLTPGSSPSSPIAQRSLKPTVILISLDGFRADFLEKYAPSHILGYFEKGVIAKSLIPVFPSSTFPNHYSIVTGLLPEHHGIVFNEMKDPKSSFKFFPGNKVAVDQSLWWGGEPIWVTAEKQGKISASMFWVGSTARIKNTLPRYHRSYDQSLPRADRVRQILEWLDLPEAERPQLLTLYFEDVDSAGHAYGPDSNEVRSAVEQVDSSFGDLISGLNRRGILDSVHIVLVSDHGMAQISDKQILTLSSLFNVEDAEFLGRGALVSLYPKPGRASGIISSIKKAKAPVRVYKKTEIPSQFRFRRHPRIPPVLIVAEEGWYLTPEDPAEMRERPKGAHGYDPSLPSMQGVFLAKGPRITAKGPIDSFESIHIYEFLSAILGVKPARNDGKREVLGKLLGAAP